MHQALTFYRWIGGSRGIPALPKPALLVHGTSQPSAGAPSSQAWLSHTLPRFMLTCSLMACAPVCTPLWAASELVMTDINLGFESLPVAYDFTINDGNTQRSGSSEFDLAFALSGRAVHAFSKPGSSGAFFAGVSGLVGACTYAEGGDYTLAIGRVVAGYAYAFDDRWTFEVMPWVGYGYGQLSIPGAGISSDYSVSGTIIDYGAQLGFTYALSQSWLIGARLGWQITSADLQGDGLDVTIDQSGPIGFLGVIYRFGGTPPSIR
jgi:hypothetical protein